MALLADLIADPFAPWVVIVLALPGLLLLTGAVVYVGIHMRADGKGRK